VRAAIAVGALLLGAGILFGALFSWSTGGNSGHGYAVLSFVALGIGSWALYSPRLRRISFILLALHVGATLLAASLYGSEVDTARALAIVDIAVALAIYFHVGHER
jgi:hypothetical protein